MRVLLLADHDFATRERGFLARLEVALADEGIGVVHAAPDRAVATTPAPGLARRLGYPDAETLFHSDRRTRRLLEAIEGDGEPGDESAIDVVHVFGSAAWGVGTGVARHSGAGLVVELFSVAQAQRAGASGLWRGVRSHLFLIPDVALERVIRRESPGAAMRVAPWGVHRMAERTEILSPDQVASMVMTGSGLDHATWAAALEGISRATTREGLPAFLVFADADAAVRAEVWPVVQRLRLTERVSLVAGVESHRDLALRADVLLLPEARGEHRSIVLEAMGAGMAVIAAADPFVSHLAHGRTALVVAGPDASLWSAAIETALRDREATRRLGEAASEYVGQHHRVSGYAAAAIDGYEWLIRREAIPRRPP